MAGYGAGKPVVVKKKEKTKTNKKTGVSTTKTKTVTKSKGNRTVVKKKATQNTKQQLIKSPPLPKQYVR